MYELNTRMVIEETSTSRFLPCLEMSRTLISSCANIVYQMCHHQHIIVYSGGHIWQQEHGLVLTQLITFFTNFLGTRADAQILI